MGKYFSCWQEKYFPIKLLQEKTLQLESLAQGKVYLSISLVAKGKLQAQWTKVAQGS